MACSASAAWVEMFFTVRTIDPFEKNPVNVSTLTTLFAFKDIGKRYHSLLFAVINHSDIVPVTVILETSEDGIHPDDDKQQVLTAPPGKQASIEVGPNLLRNYFRLSAHTDGPSYPTAPINWTIRGIPR